MKPKKQPSVFYQRRKDIRRELLVNRQRDCDNSEARLVSDGKRLDAQLLAEGFLLIYSTDWGKDRSRTSTGEGVANFLDEGVE